MKKVAIVLSLGLFLSVSCTKREQESQVSNVSFTPCQQTKATKSEISDRVDVEFTNQGVGITYYNFAVTCDFTTVDVTHTFVNGVLNITQQGLPNQANCICHTDVSYTIEGLSKNEVNVIFINGVQVYCHNDNEEKSHVSKVLMLIVDYTTNTFKGGKELGFSEKTETFTVSYEYAPPGDFGHIKLFYKEINELLFFGTIHWMGCGKMEFPQNLLDANQFQAVITDDFVAPKNGFEDVFPQFDITFDYEMIWGRVQFLGKARDYLRSNPEQVVKMFLYTPSVGVGNPEDWYWLIFLTH